MSYDDLKDFSGRPLTRKERQEFRKWMKMLDRMSWLAWLFLKIVGIAAAIQAGFTMLKGYLPWFAKAG